MCPEAGQEAVDTERFLVEEGRTLQTHAFIEVLVEILVEAIDVDPQFLQQAECFLAVVVGRFQRLSSSIADQQPLTGLELIALRMPAEIIVIVENQNLRAGSSELAEEVRGGKATDSSTHDHEIVRFLVVDSIRPGLAVAHGVRHFP